MNHCTEIGETSTELMKKGYHGSVDTNKLATSMQEEFNKLRPFSDECSIYRVPKRLLQLNRSAYTPQVVSIGPLHHGKKELKEMEEHKKMYLQDFLELSEVSLKDFLAVIAERETRLRNCYAATFKKLSSEKFVKMMLLDCSFVIMVLMRFYFPNIGSRNDGIFSKPWMIHDVSKDMCLLENQLPFFMLEDLIKLSKKLDHEYECSLIKLTRWFLSIRWSSWVPEDISEEKFCEGEHFVAFLRICLQPTEPKEKKIDTLSTPSAMDLHQAGVKFKLGTSEKLLDIKFDHYKGTLEIPCLKIVDSTETLFRNVQAFEQCHFGEGFIGNYIEMINLVVQSSKDLEILARKEIIQNWLRDNDALLNLLHNLAKENIVSCQKFHFSDVVEDLNNYYGKRRHKWKAALKQKYFDNPWTIISVIAAGILLLLTVIQTVCSII